MVNLDDLLEKRKQSNKTFHAKVDTAHGRYNTQMNILKLEKLREIDNAKGLLKKDEKKFYQDLSKIIYDVIKQGADPDYEPIRFCLDDERNEKMFQQLTNEQAVHYREIHEVFRDYFITSNDIYKAIDLLVVEGKVEKITLNDNGGCLPALKVKN